MAIKDDLKNALEGALVVPVLDESESVVFPCATIQIYQRRPEAFGDGIPNRIVNYTTLNLWYRSETELDEAVEIATQVLVSIGTTYPTEDKEFDTSARCHRATLNFSI